jgi:hypothetical protein
VTPLLVLGAFVGVMVALAGALTLLCRVCLGGPPPAPKKSRRRRRLRLIDPEQDPTPDGFRPRRPARARRIQGPVTRRRPVQEVAADLPMGTGRDIERLRVVCMLEAAGLVVQD